MSSGCPNARHHFRGSLSMANTARSAQHGRLAVLSHLRAHVVPRRQARRVRPRDRGHGRGRLAQAPRPERPGPKPTPDKILKAEVLRDRGHEYKFEKLPELSPVNNLGSEGFQNRLPARLTPSEPTPILISRFPILPAACIGI